MRKQNWRLRKTLSRKIDVRPMHPDDLKYLWAAYKKGGLSALGEQFASAEMSSDEFKAAFEETAERYSEGFTIFAETAKGLIPAGVVFGDFAKPPTHMTISGIVWFPWASKRNIVEGSIAFFNWIRKQIHIVGYAADEHKRLYEVVCMHGIMRRVGTSQVVLPGKSAAVYETRA